VAIKGNDLSVQPWNCLPLASSLNEIVNIGIVYIIFTVMFYYLELTVSNLYDFSSLWPWHDWTRSTYSTQAETVDFISWKSDIGKKRF